MKLLTPKSLTPLPRRQQVAAVCYRMGKRGIEFLLVQTLSGRWIFPKGGAEPGLTRAQSAALEAFEEAGVHGRIEEIAFTRYFRRQLISDAAGPAPVLAVAAHLCEVAHLERPQEANRNPTWFSAAKTKRRLIKDRPPEFGEELARVIDRAVSRISRLRARSHDGPHRSEHGDGLLEARFDFAENGRSLYNLRTAKILRKIVAPRAGAVLRLGSGGSSSAHATQNVTAIDSARKTITRKSNGVFSNRPKAAGKL
jgi:8-oxo-dGTP pyrophosphatase MutT (NUDIX family)